MKKSQVLEILTNDAKDKVLEISDVDTFCRRLGLSSEDTTSVMHSLEDKALIKVPKGFSSMSPLQKKIHRFFNDEFLEALLKYGKVSFQADENELKSLVKDDDKCYVLNKKGDLIKPSCNNTNITNQRLVAKAKKDAEQLAK